MLLPVLCFAALVQAQTSRPIGAIVALDAAARRLAIKTDAGPELSIVFQEATRFLRVSPGAKDLQNAAVISASDLAVGDRILAQGRSGGDAGPFVAATIIVMSQGDIAQKRAAERAEWEKRGVGGVITAVNSASREITINAPAAPGAKSIVIAFAPGAVLRRYAPNSVKFSEARPSSFEELQVGDQVKALGASSQDRSRLSAEELVSGSFRNIAATVATLDVERRTIQITDLATNKRLQAQVTSDSTMRRLPAAVAQMLAARTAGSRDVQSAIEALPPLSLTDLKPGDAVIVACTNSDDPSRVTAITVLAGVEPVLRSSPGGSRPLDLGSWNLDLNMNVGAP